MKCHVCKLQDNERSLIKRAYANDYKYFHKECWNNRIKKGLKESVITVPQCICQAAFNNLDCPYNECFV